MMTNENLLEAVEKALKNAEDLFDEAVILKSHGKIARAYTLFQFSIEEIGKASMTFHFAMHGNLNNQKELNTFLKNFRNHQIKTEASQGLDFMLVMMSEISDFTKKLLKNFLEKDNNQSLNLSNDKKNYSLYTSLIKGKFCEPQQIISKKDLEEIETYADLRLKIAKPFFSLGVKNFETLHKTKHLLNEEKTLEDGMNKLTRLLD